MIIAILIITVLALTLLLAASMTFAFSMQSQRDDALDQLEGAQADLDHARTEYRALVAASEAHPIVTARMARQRKDAEGPIEDLVNMSDHPVRLAR